MEHDDLNFGVKVGETKGMEPAPDTHRELQEAASDEYNLGKAAHPLACVFTFLFKGLALLVYLVVGNFLSNVTTFILVVVLSALDFWTVKNVTGRLLVGLRWWSDFDEQGKEVWRFESYDREYQSNKVDAAFFWTAQYSAVGVWTAFLVMKVIGLSFFWGLLVFINWSLTATNLYGYFKCQRDYGNKLKQLKGQLAGKFLEKLIK